jgi:hypothetical protein
VSFPQLAARDLGGREVALPAGLPGERNVVLIAFRRDQQRLADSWVPWLEQRAATDPGLGFVELLGMAFDPRFRLPLAALRMTPATAHVTVAADRLVACFGPWVCHTTSANVRAVSLTGPYRWPRAIGSRLSLADHGLTLALPPPAGSACSSANRCAASTRSS